jgi:hypothetical protein
MVFIIFCSFLAGERPLPTRLKSGSEIPRGKIFFLCRGRNFLVSKPVMYVKNWVDGGREESAAPRIHIGGKFLQSVSKTGLIDSPQARA